MSSGLNCFLKKIRAFLMNTLQKRSGWPVEDIHSSESLPMKMRRQTLTSLHAIVSDLTRSSASVDTSEREASLAGPSQ